jgi:hypothetical protein
MIVKCLRINIPKLFCEMSRVTIELTASLCALWLNCIILEDFFTSTKASRLFLGADNPSNFRYTFGIVCYVQRDT